MASYLIAGLGNPGPEYQFTRHNIGFLIADALCTKHDAGFILARHGWVSNFRMRGKAVTVLKPSTYMNLSGKAVRYWMSEGNVEPENLMVIADDVALPFGKIRIRPSGSDGGHNGFKSINELLRSDGYPRLRFGVGNDYPKGKQADYVLGVWKPEEQIELKIRVALAVEAVESFIAEGLSNCMNRYNNK